MKIVVLDGFAANPGDLSWEGMKVLGECTIYDRTAPEEVLERAHQFILWYLVYHTSLIYNVGITELPFFLLSVTLVVSVVLAQMSLKTRVGRFLIG